MCGGCRPCPRRARVALQQLQQRAQTLGAAGCERDDDVSSETLPRRAPVRPALSIAGGKSDVCDLSLVKRVLQRLFAELRRVGEKLPELLDLFLDVVLGSARCRGFDAVVAAI